MLSIRRVISNLLGIVRNAFGALKRTGLDYVVIGLTGSYPERRQPEPSLPFPFGRLVSLPTEPTLEGLRHQFEALALDKRIQGVVLRISQLTADGGTIQELRALVKKLQANGKDVICWLPSLDTPTLYLASACDHVFLPQSAPVFAAGLRAETLFLKEALSTIGVEADFEALREYKTTPDTFRRTEMTEAHREMLEAILESSFDELVEGIADGRGLTPEQVRTLLDRMPLSADEAVKAGLADGTLYEDELAARLGSQEEPAALTHWVQARRWLRRPIHWPERPVIGVISVKGMIVPGPSRRMPPVPLPIPSRVEQAGSTTVTQLLRAAEEDQHIAAVILHVESPGGSTLASDLIWRAVKRLRQQKPVVVLMGNTAASGGYYISAPANAIVCQPLTLTGSIGIWGGKFVTSGLFDKLGIRREAIQRGARADLYSDEKPFTEEQRRALREQIGVGYDRFKSRVAEGRGLSLEKVEEVARGRVWTGRQALEQGLVDALGGFEVALARAKELADLDPERWYPVTNVSLPQRPLLPQPYPSGEALLQAAIDYARALEQDHLWALSPWQIRTFGP